MDFLQLQISIAVFQPCQPHEFQYTGLLLAKSQLLAYNVFFSKCSIIILFIMVYRQKIDR